MVSTIHTRRLAQFLEMDAMGASELKKTVDHTVPRELSYHDFDGKIVNARELLISEGIQGSTLIPTEIYATVMEGAEPARCMREVLPMFSMKGISMSMPYGESGTYAPVVSEGAEIPVQDQTYSGATFTAKKYAVRPLITNEMIDDALFDVIAAEVRKSGMRLENALNYKALDVCLSNYNNSAACGGAGATPLVFAAKLVAELQADGMTPTHMVCAPAYVGLSMAEAIPFANNYATEVIKGGALGNIMGCQTHLLGIALATSTTNSKTWGFTSSASYVGAVMLDANHCGGIGMRQDIKVEQYADSIRQMQGVSCSMRFDVQAMLTDAIGVITY